MRATERLSAPFLSFAGDYTGVAVEGAFTDRRPPSFRVRLRAWYRRLEATDAGAGGRKPGGQAGAKGLRAGSESEGNKDNKQGIFASAPATLTTPKGSDQIEHFRCLLPVRSWLCASALMEITPAMQPTCRLTMCSQHRVQ